MDAWVLGVNEHVVGVNGFRCKWFWVLVVNEHLVGGNGYIVVWVLKVNVHVLGALSLGVFWVHFALGVLGALCVGGVCVFV